MAAIRPWTCTFSLKILSQHLWFYQAEWDFCGCSVMLWRTKISWHVFRWTETLSGQLKCQKIQSNSEWLPSSPYGEVFLSWWKWNVLRMILSLHAVSGQCEGVWKWKQYESLTVAGAVTTSQLSSASWCGNGNSMLHDCKGNTEE